MNVKHDELMNGNRSRLMRVLTLLAAMALVASSAISFARIAGFDTAGSYAKEDDTRKEIEEAFPELTADDEPAESPLSKDETTYVIMDRNGERKEIIVEEWLKNNKKARVIEDSSRLKDIENVSGEEKFTRSGNSITWEAKGRDIKYSGTTDDELPIDVEVTYMLNGEEMTAEEISGKSGNVEIHFDYTINAMETVPYGGGNYTVHHPYLVASGLLLPKDSFSDVTVKGGRSMTEGDNIICLGVALPSIAEDLGLGDSYIDIPESVVIKAKTDKFKIDGTYTAAISGILNNIGSTGAVTGKLEALESALGQLSDASSKLVSGSRELSAGADKLFDGAGKLEVGTDSLRTGTRKLSKGVSKLYSGTDSLADGSTELSKGMSELRENSDKLADGVDELSSGGEKLAKGSAALKEGSKKGLEGAKELSEGLGQISGSSAKLNESTAAIEKSVFDSTTTSLRASLVQAFMGQGMPEDEAVAQAKALVPDLSASNYAGVIDNLKKVLPEAASAFDKAKASLDGIVAYTAGVKQYTDGVDSCAEGSASLYEGLKSLDGGIDTVDGGIGEISAGLSKLSGSMPELKEGVKALDEGAAKLDKGANKLNKGTRKLAKSTKKLHKGTSTIEDGMDKLANGTGDLAGGADKLRDGIYRFDREGISQLVSSLDTTEVVEIARKFDAVKEASSRTYYVGGTRTGLGGRTKLIFKTGEV